MKTFIYRFGNLLVVVCETNAVDALAAAARIAKTRHEQNGIPFDRDLNHAYEIELDKGGTFVHWV